MRTNSLLTLAACLACTLPAFSQSKMTPPPPAPPRPYEFPKAATKTLPNGLRVIVVEDHRLPLVSATLDILAGNAYMDPKKSGLASIVAGLLREGTATRTSQQIAKAATCRIHQDKAHQRQNDNTGGYLSILIPDFLNYSHNRLCVILL